jgi:hypothetical protein
MNPPSAAQATLYTFRYAPPDAPESAISFDFSDPVPRRLSAEATLLSDPPASGGGAAQCEFEILVVAPSLRDDARWREGLAGWLAQPAPPEAVSVNSGRVLVAWRRTRAQIAALPEQAHAALEAVVEFAYYENELRKLEEGLAGSWPSVEADLPLAYDIAASKLRDDEEIGQRVRQALQRRITLARIEPHLYFPPARFSNLARELGESLREATRCEERAEFADGQMEAQEYVYEMASQRLGEFRHARHAFYLEVLIVALLAAEVVLMVIRIL